MEGIEVWRTGISAGAVLVTLLGIACGIRRDMGLRAGRLREDFNFTRNFRSSFGGAEIDGLFKERAYHALIGRDDIPAEAVEYLVTFREPSRSVRPFHRSGSKLAVASYRSRKRLFYTGIYKKKVMRNLLSGVSFLGYIIF
jgi:hypothetical protein